jgi:hypothetical protein
LALVLTIFTVGSLVGAVKVKEIAMQYIDQETGEIFDLVPYRPRRRPVRHTVRQRYVKSLWATVFTELLPVLVGLALLWALLTFAR